jgi:predicted  nucleic acid-binding Zn-ribbon protein
MTAILSILGEIWPFLLAGLGMLFGYVRHKQAQTTAAQADTKVAAAEKREAQAGAEVERANTQAAQAGADAAKERTDVENRIAADQPGESLRVLRDDWSR